VKYAIGATLTMKSMKDSPVALAIMMLGGSPTSVAAPPMLHAITSIRISGTGLMSNASASRNVIGTISRIVVRLSRNADSTAVGMASATTSRNGRPLDSCPARIAMNV
jgi:hypothetical protein